MPFTRLKMLPHGCVDEEDKGTQVVACVLAVIDAERGVMRKIPMLGS